MRRNAGMKKIAQKTPKFRDAPWRMDSELKEALKFFYKPNKQQ